MKNTRKMLSAALCCCVAIATTSCFNYQKKWVRELAKEFPDDTFTYRGVEPGELGPHGDIANVDSEEYPDLVVRIIKTEDNELITNYNYVRYRDDIVDYYRDYFDAYFASDDISILYNPPRYHAEYTPITDMSLESYMDRYVSCGNVAIDLYYESELPVDEELVIIIRNILEDMNDEEVHFVIYVHNGDSSENEYVRSYSVMMSEPGLINYIIVRERGGNAVYLVDNERF